MVKNRYCAGKNNDKERIFDLDAEQDQHETGNEQQVMHQEQEGALPGRAIAEAGILAKEIGHGGEKKLGQALVKVTHFAAGSQKRPD